MEGEGIVRIVLIGLGGIGGLMALHLSKIARDNALLELLLIDGDVIEPSNLDRQFFLTSGNKAEAWAGYLTEQIGFKPKVSALPIYLKDASFIKDGDIVLLCVDNHYTRRLVDDVCSMRNDITLISGGNEEFDGNVQWYSVLQGYRDAETLSERHPEITLDKRPDFRQHCDQVVDNKQTYVANMTASTIMANVLWDRLNDFTMIGSEVYFDVQRCKQRLLSNKQREAVI
jgi:molybdopterin/thiamine biosynthesis adenylyltransferase